MELDLTGKVAVVTGAAHRVGRAIALELAGRGMNVLVHYNSTAPEETVRDIRALGVAAEAQQADVSTAQGVEAVFGAVMRHFGRLDVLVNSASVFPAGRLDETSLETWQNALDVNLTGPMLCTQAGAALMRQNEGEGGCIVNICDVGVSRPWAARAAHGVSKSALWMLTQTAAVTYAPEIRVNAVMPGPVLAPPGMSEARWAQIGQDLTLLGRAGAAEDVARAVGYLVREDFITGALLPVNGGEHLKW